MQAVGSSYQFSNNIYNNSQNHSNNVVFGQNFQSDDSNQKLAMNVGEVAVASWLLHYMAEFLSKKLMDGKEFTSSKNVHKVADSMLEENKLKDVVQVEYIDHQNKFLFGQEIAPHLEPVARGENAFYMDKVKLAVAPKSKPSLILHELGHAINAHKGNFIRFLQKSRNWAVSVPTVLVALHGLFKNDKDSKPNIIQRNAGLIGFAAYVPTIVEEGMASWRGINAAKKVLGNTNLNVLKRNYAFALGTYVLSGIGLGIAAKQSVME